MGKSSGGGNTQTTETNTEIPDWQRNMVQNYYQYGNQLTSPFMQYTPENVVAGFNPDQTMAFELTRDMAQNAFQGGPTNVPDAHYNAYTINPAQMGQAPNMDAASYDAASMQAAGGFQTPEMQAAQVQQSGGYNPSAYQANTGNAATSNVNLNNYFGPDNVAQADAATMGNAQSNYDLSGLDNAAGTGTSFAGAATSNYNIPGRLGNASEMDAAQGHAAQLGGTDYQQFMNPYINDVVDATTAQAREQYGRTMADIGSRSAAAGAFGGSREALMRNQAAEDFDRNLQSTVANLMSQGFDTATANALANSQMRQQSNMLNTQMRQEANSTNAAANNQFALTGAQMGLQQAMQNAGWRNEARQANADRRQDTLQFNAAADNQFAQQQAQLGLQQAMQNAGYQQEALGQNAQFAQQSGLANASALNNMAQLLGSSALDQSRFNAGNRQQMGLANMQALNNASQYGADAQNNMLSQLLGINSQESLAQAGYQQQANQFNTGNEYQQLMQQMANQQQANAVNSGYQQQAASEGAGYQQQANQFNTDLDYQRMLQNFQAQMQARLANQGAVNSSRQFNESMGLEEARLQDQFASTDMQRQMDALRQLQGIGGQQQELANTSLNTPYNMLQMLGQTVPGGAQGQDSTTVAPDNSPSWWQQLLGFGAATSGVWGPALFSDEDAKTDKKKLGKDPDSGLTMYAYRYKDDPKSYPKVVGPMAQESEKKYPGSTKRVGGHMAMLLN